MANEEKAATAAPKMTVESLALELRLVTKAAGIASPNFNAALRMVRGKHAAGEMQALDASFPTGQRGSSKPDSSGLSKRLKREDPKKAAELQAAIDKG